MRLQTAVGAGPSVAVGRPSRGRQRFIHAVPALANSCLQHRRQPADDEPEPQSSLGSQTSFVGRLSRLQGCQQILIGHRTGLQAQGLVSRFGTAGCTGIAFQQHRQLVRGKGKSGRFLQHRHPSANQAHRQPDGVQPAAEHSGNPLQQLEVREDIGAAEVELGMAGVLHRTDDGFGDGLNVNGLERERSIANDGHKG